MLLLKIYFPDSLMELGILLISVLVLTSLIKKLLYTGNKKVEMPWIFIFACIVLLVLLWLLIARGIPKIVELIEQINIPKAPIWLWIAVALLILLIIFWKKIPGIKKPEKIKGGLIWKVLGGIAVILIGYYAYYKWQDYKAKKLAWRPNVVIGNSDRKDPLIGSPYLKMDGENFMEKGQFFQFDVDWDQPGISFDPETDEKVILYFQKAEDRTRKWKLVLWKNKQGEKEYSFSPSAPIAEALIGKVYVKSEISSVNVVVSRK